MGNGTDRSGRRTTPGGSPTAPAPGTGAGDVYIYFDNDEKTRAPFDARRLMERLGLADGYPPPGTGDAKPE